MKQSPRNSTVRLLHDAFELVVDAAAKEEVEAASGREGGTSVEEVNEAHTFLAQSVAAPIRQLCVAGNGEAEAGTHIPGSRDDVTIRVSMELLRRAATLTRRDDGVSDHPLCLDYYLGIQCSDDNDDDVIADNHHYT